MNVQHNDIPARQASDENRGLLRARHRNYRAAKVTQGLLVLVSILLPIIGVWLAIVLLTGYVGLATISAAVSAAGLVGLLYLPERHALFVFACATAALLVYAHRGNIQRMLNGTESRFTRRGRLLGK